MLVVENIWAKGRHNGLFGPTSFELERGETIIIQADSQLQRTALSLTLTGRMKPSGGSIYSTGKRAVGRGRVEMKKLRAQSELIDSPEVTEPENHMRVRDYVSEMLSYIGSPLTRPKTARWLVEQELADLDNLWIEELTGEQNIRLMSALASSYTHADLLVFDTPSRHFNHAEQWLPYLVELAQDPAHLRGVVAVVPHISSSWHGKRTVVGSAHREFNQQKKGAVARQEPVGGNKAAGVGLAGQEHSGCTGANDCKEGRSEEGGQE